MKRRRTRSADPFENLLDGRSSDDSALAQLFTAAQAPGTREELAGLPVARTAFLETRSPAQARRVAMSRLPAATRTAAGNSSC